MNIKKRIQIMLLLFIGLSSSVFAEEYLSVSDAYIKARNNEIILIDIRSENEWEETSIPSVAKPLSMHDAQFLTKFLALSKQANGKPIALICATGGRTAWLKKELSRRGITNLLDVSEGMMGSSAGVGWLRTGLPITAYTENTSSPLYIKYTFWERYSGSYSPLWLEVK